MEEIENQMPLIIKDWLVSQNLDAALEWIETNPVMEVADVIDDLDEEDAITLINLIDAEDRGLLFSYLSLDTQTGIFEKINIREFSKMFKHMLSDVRVDLYRELDRDQQLELLPFLDRKTREEVIHLSSYPGDTAGGIMHTDFVTVLSEMTIAEAINKIRTDGHTNKMVYYVYVVDFNMRLTGIVTLKDLIMAESETLIQKEMNPNVITAEVYDDRETVAKQIEKYDLVAIPVVNKNHQLLGIVSHDDAIDVIRAEHTEDFEKFMGMMQSREGTEYLETSTLDHFRRRVVWIVSLAALGIVSGVIIHSYENVFDSLIILALYMPMVADAGGNAGSQAATVVVRALALGQITARNYFRVIYKEARIAVLLSICLGVLSYLKVMFLSWETEVPSQFNLSTIGMVIALAISLQVISSTVIGASLPLLVKRFGGDPAVAASPAITTIVDITGLLIYFGIATIFLFS